MLPIIDKPLVQYAVEEAIAIGIEEIIFITSPVKNSIQKHFDKSHELEKKLISSGKNDFLEKETQKKILNIFEVKIDIIISDMAENTTGNKSVDSIRTNNLCSTVINFSLKTLNKNGTLICKLFMGEDFLEVKNLAKNNFKKVDFFKPESSRSESKETYIICSLLKPL